MQISIISSTGVEENDDRESQAVSLLQDLPIYLFTHICLPPRTTQASAVADRESKAWAIRSEATAAGAPSYTSNPPVLALAPACHASTRLRACASAAALTFKSIKDTSKSIKVAIWETIFYEMTV